MLLDGRTFELLTTGTTATSIGRVVVTGQSRPADIYELADADAPHERAAAVEQLVTAFRAGDLPAAGHALAAPEQQGGAPDIARLYRISIDDSITDGVLRLTEK